MSRAPYSVFFGSKVRGGYVLSFEGAFHPKVSRYTNQIPISYTYSITSVDSLNGQRWNYETPPFFFLERILRHWCSRRSVVIETTELSIIQKPDFLKFPSYIAFLQESNLCEVR